MGQAKRRGTFEERRQQSIDASMARLAESRRKEEEKKRKLDALIDRWGGLKAQWAELPENERQGAAQAWWDTLTQDEKYHLRRHQERRQRRGGMSPVLMATLATAALMGGVDMRR